MGQKYPENIIFLAIWYQKLHLHKNSTKFKLKITKTSYSLHDVKFFQAEKISPGFQTEYNFLGQPRKFWAPYCPADM